MENVPLHSAGFYLDDHGEMTFHIISDIGNIHCIVLPNGNVSAYAYHRGIVVSPTGKIVKSLPPMLDDLHKMDNKEIWDLIHSWIVDFIKTSEVYKMAVNIYASKRSRKSEANPR